jgi:hypothetical protein
MKSTKSKIIFSTIAAVLGLSLFGTVSHAQAEDICSQNSANYPEAVWEAAGCNDNTSNALPGFIVSILNGIIAVSGLIAVIYVVIGGINYMTSAGDSAKLQKAKSTILYACIGIAIAALSFAIVNFVIVNIIGGQSSEPESSQEEGENADINSSGNSSEGENPLLKL